MVTPVWCPGAANGRTMRRIKREVDQLFDLSPAGRNSQKNDEMFVEGHFSGSLKCFCLLCRSSTVKRFQTF